MRKSNAISVATITASFLSLSFMVFSFFEFLTYMLTWILGYAYAIRVGATDWDETTTLAPEKLGPQPASEVTAEALSLEPAVGGVN